MAMLSLRASYFAIENPWRLLDRWINPCRYRQTVQINQRRVDVAWTARAERALRASTQPLVVEMQLYFSCVVKKRVLFHRHTDFATVRVDDRLEIAFRPVAAAACDPYEFALHYPAARDLSAGPAARMVPRQVEIDFRAGRWQGRFGYA
jgi:hypothetical protein